MNKVISNLVSGAKKGAAATVKKAKAFVVNPRMGMLSMKMCIRDRRCASLLGIAS